MVSNKDAGTIIGRGGSTIAGLQNKSGARIKVSNANEYFPGTQVCDTRAFFFGKVSWLSHSI